MAENKTKPTGVNVYDFVEQVPDKIKREDSYELIRLMKGATGCEPNMWGPTIIGFGSYHYKYASGHQGDAPRLGFSPRKAAISLYVFSGMKEHVPLLKDLGKFKMGKLCIYVKRLSDINMDALKK